MSENTLADQVNAELLGLQLAFLKKARAAVEGEIAMVERGGGTGLDALSAVVEQAAIVHVQRAGVFQIHSVAAIAVDARVIKIDDAPITGGQSSCTVVPNFNAVDGQV